MKLEQSFVVAAPLERVWAALVDVERAAPCLPGASVVGRNEDGSYEGSFRVRLGPTSADYSGKLVLESVDPDSRTATMQAQGTDRRGQGGATATIFSSLSPAGDGTTRIAVVADYQITGRLAHFGRAGMIDEISRRLLEAFAQSLESSLAGESQGPTAATPLATEEGGDVVADPALAGAMPVSPEPARSRSPSLVASAIWEQVRRNAVPVVALILGFLLALRVLGRRD